VQVIDGWLVADKDVPRKQRHSARRVWQRLVAEHGATVSEVTVSRHVARRRTELGVDRVDVAVPQEHLPGCIKVDGPGDLRLVLGGCEIVFSGEDVGWQVWFEGDTAGGGGGSDLPVAGRPARPGRGTGPDWPGQPACGVVS
jgi:hypothetical protein